MAGKIRKNLDVIGLRRLPRVVKHGIAVARMEGRRKKHLRNRRRSASGTATPDLIFGLHAASAALANPARSITRVFATKNAANRLASTLEAAGAHTEVVSASDLSVRLGRQAVHQGVLVETAPLPEIDLDTVLSPTAARQGAVIMLDQLTDPHNVGAIVRSAAAFGAGAIVLTRRHSPRLDGVLAKAASGGLEAVPVVKVTNLARALEAAGDAGLPRIGLAGDAEQTLNEANLDQRCVLVLGAEGKGLRRLTRENCDFHCRIPMSGGIASLNVSNAAAIALYTLFIARNADIAVARSSSA